MMALFLVEAASPLSSLCLCRHFKPDPKQIKKRIEDLIAREYLERDSNNNNVYKYLA